MKTFGWTLLFFLSFQYGMTQSCDQKKGLQEIEQFNSRGVFKKALTLSKELLKCDALEANEKIALYVWQYKLYRNSYRSSNSRRALLKAIDIAEKTQMSINTELKLLLAEYYALRRKRKEYQKLIVEIEKDTLSNLFNDFQRGQYHLIRYYSSRSGNEIYLLKALALFEKNSKTPLYYVGNALRGLGNTKRSAGDFDKAITYYQRELELYKTAQFDANHFEISICHYNLGGVYYEKLEYQTALDHFLEAHKIWKDIYKPKSSRMRSLNEAIGDMYFELDDYKNALEFFNLAVDNEKKINNDTSELTLEKGDSLMQNGDYKDAIDYYKEALKWREETYGKNHLLTGACKNFVARALSSSGNIRSSLQMYQGAMNILVEEMNGTSWKKNPTIDMKIQSNKYLLETLVAKGDLLNRLYTKTQKIEDLQTAIETYETALQVLESLKNNISESSKKTWVSRTIALVESSIETALLLYKLTQDKSYVEKAFNFSERSKALVLLASLYDQEVTNFAKVPKEILEKERALKKEINEYEGRIQNEEKRCEQVREKILKLNNEKLLSLEDEYSLLINTLKKKYPEYYNLKYSTQVADLITIKSQLLDEKTGMISYFSGNKKLYVFYLTQDIISARTLKKEEVSKQEITSFFTSVNTQFPNKPEKAYQHFIKSGFTLYQKLLQPELINAKENNLIINPDGNLWYIPFETLLTQKVDTKQARNYKTLPYMLKNYNVSYTPSASIRLLSENTKNVAYQYMGFAPEYQNRQYADSLISLSVLQHNQSEINFAKELFKGKSWTGNRSTEETFKTTSSKAGVLHFAMHAEMENTHPLLSKLYFTPSEKEDGILHTYEIYNLDLSSQLVILSGCNTASGKLERGEGIISLERAFQYAGSKAMLSTLWSVDDEASSTIVQSFLENLNNGDTKDIALQKAKLYFLKTATPEKLHPFYWSHFKLTGNTKPLQKESKTVYYIMGVLLLVIVSRTYLKRKKQS